MNGEEGLADRWLDLRVVPPEGSLGLGPALGWLAGSLTSGQPLWGWPDLAWFLLGLFLAVAVWGRLWAMLGVEAVDTAPSTSSDPGDTADPVRLFRLPYTVPGSLSEEWGAALGRAWHRLWGSEARRRFWSEVLVLGALLLVLAALWGHGTLLAALAGLALLGLRRLVRGRPAALSLLRVFGGLSWPWWLGRLVWAPQSAESMLLSLLWGLAFACWADLPAGRAAGRPLVWTDLAQCGVIAFFLFSGRLVVGGILAFALLAQVLLQAGLGRTGRRAEVAARTWPFAAAGAALSGLALGGWV